MGKTIQETQQVHSVSDQTHREDGLDPLAGSGKQVILPQTQKTPTSTGGDERPNDSRAGPAPDKGAGLLESKDQKNRRRREQEVAQKVDLGDCCRCIVSVASFLRPERVDGQHGQGTKRDTANMSATGPVGETTEGQPT